jgi:hypothetical protein
VDRQLSSEGPNREPATCGEVVRMFGLKPVVGWPRQRPTGLRVARRSAPTCSRTGA